MNNAPQTLAINIGDAELAHGSYRLVADAGHLIPMEKPKEIFQIIADFLLSL
ncbi:MAG: hypothetical protein WCB15_15310 [Desulfobacterales bacterium]